MENSSQSLDAKEHQLGCTTFRQHYEVAATAARVARAPPGNSAIVCRILWCRAEKESTRACMRACSASHACVGGFHVGGVCITRAACDLVSAGAGGQSPFPPSNRGILIRLSLASTSEPPVKQHLTGVADVRRRRRWAATIPDVAAFSGVAKSSAGSRSTPVHVCTGFDLHQVLKMTCRLPTWLMILVVLAPAGVLSQGEPGKPCCCFMTCALALSTRKQGRAPTACWLYLGVSR